MFFWKIDLTNSLNTTIGLGYWEGILLVFVGISVFLMSIKMMSTSIRNVGSEKFKKILLSFSKRPIIGIFAGFAFTSMIQSSDGAVALIMGLLAAKFIDLKGAIAFVIGANVGTATTSIIVALEQYFKISNYLLMLCVIGGFIFLFFKKEKWTKIGFLIFSIGMIFLGLKILGSAVKVLVQSPVFSDFIKKFGQDSASSNWISFFFSIALTALFQSSSATIAIYQAIISQGENILSLSSGIALVLGANIGTTITAIIIAFVSGDKNSKRIAISWLFSNFSIALIAMSLVGVAFAPFVRLIVPGENEIAAWQLSIAHLLFNIFLAVVFFFFIKQLVWLCFVLIKKSEDEKTEGMLLPKTLVNVSVEFALLSAKKSTMILTKSVISLIEKFKQYINQKGPKSISIERDLEVIREYKKELYKYSVLVSKTNLNEKESKINLKLILAHRSLEKISQLLREVLEDYNKTKSQFKKINEEFYKKWKEQIIKILDINIQILNDGILQLENPEISKLSENRKIVRKTDSMINKYSHNFHADLQQLDLDKKDYILDIEILNILKNLERISHHGLRLLEV
ncbi:Na/Pi cotransporter family protein [Mycoplasmopsis pulmonis]|uniref:Na/Pi cotransporter family protein n=1 Tax=Mycoplasmopsis pulmonis TaxID=2107 RepID=UPI0010051F21|nr:Na/Pi cotransporter family protein [Mycoplasmopsis pulmonis]MDZ7293299.1 Na/Pi cotransporter family protein [Mycoplasmopsis pulmonis]VEU68104.1 Na/Pi-cotransporter II-related protein [Mycoplasmopsis pulmonis]